MSGGTTRKASDRASRPITPATRSGSAIRFNDLLMIRPEIGYYHSYDVPAFNLGKSNNLLMGGFDFTIRF